MLVFTRVKAITQLMSPVC